MKDIPTILREILEATDAVWQPEDLRAMTILAEESTTRMIYGLLRRKPLAGLLAAANEQRLAPAARETLGIIDAQGIASSKEIAREFGLGASSASNRLSTLETAGLVHRVFAFTPVGGGRRNYYARTGRLISQSEINLLKGRLGAGSLILAESDAITE